MALLWKIFIKSDAWLELLHWKSLDDKVGLAEGVVISATLTCLSYHLTFLLFSVIFHYVAMITVDFHLDLAGVALTRFWFLLGVTLPDDV